MTKRYVPLKSRQGGAVAIVTGLAIVVLIGFLGLVIDLGRMFVIKTELQNATDACALAAAQELNGTADALTRGVATGSTVGNRNSASFQGTALNFTTADISFSPVLSPNSSYRTIAGGAVASTARYAMCTMPMNNINTYFIQVLNLLPGVNIGPQTVGAYAVATLRQSQVACLIPLGFCTNTTPPASCPGGGAPSAYGHCPGSWYSGRFDAGGGSTGSFNWIDFTPTSPGNPPCTGGGTAELGCLLEGGGFCGAAVGLQVGKPGNLGNAAAKSWNSRFGLYQGGAGNPQATTAATDFTGYAYTPTNWPSQLNARTGTSPVAGAANFNTKRVERRNYNNGIGAGGNPTIGNGITGLGIGNAYNVSSGGTSGTHGTLGADRRLVSAPIINCANWETTNHQAPIQNVACVLMLHPIGSPGDTVRMEYVGLASDPGSPCSTFGSGTGTGIGPRIPVLVQ